jgi:hypothetical protein
MERATGLVYAGTGHSAVAAKSADAAAQSPSRSPTTLTVACESSHCRSPASHGSRRKGLAPSHETPTPTAASTAAATKKTVRSGGTHSEK